MEIPISDIDYYELLGLPSGEEGSKFTVVEISKAYKQKALILHPDKNPNDPNANSKFTQLKSAYEILKNESSRKIFDDLLKLRREKEVRDGKRDAKRRRMVSDLEERERGFVDPEKVAKAEEERLMKKLKDEVKKFREKLANKGKREETQAKQRENVGETTEKLDKSKVLKVSWVKGGDYNAARLRELFEEFGEVEDVVIRNKPSAFIVMASKDDVAAATGQLIGDLSNPLLVLPLQPTNPMPSVRAQDPIATKDDPVIGNVVGAGHQAYENSILEKLKKAAQNQK